MKTNGSKMSEEELRAQELRDKINKIAIEIEILEETARKKNAYIENKINKEFNLKISEVELKLQKQQAILDDLVSRIDDLTSKKKELIPIIKKLEKEYNTLKKNKKNAQNENFKAIAKEKRIKTKEIDRDIKLLEKELKTNKPK
jgi:outer membrane murein-binding lipoprotein Lpp